MLDILAPTRPYVMSHRYIGATLVGIGPDATPERRIMCAAILRALYDVVGSDPKEAAEAQLYIDSDDFADDCALLGFGVENARRRVAWLVQMAKATPGGMLGPNGKNWRCLL